MNKNKLAALSGVAIPKERYGFLAGRTVEDVLNTREFAEALRTKLDGLEEVRKKDENFKWHCVERLMSLGCWNVEKFTEVYKQVINKVCPLPSRLRMFVSIVGGDAYVDAVKKMGKDETSDL